ncbi:37S ribosomal protein rsm22 [Sporothrix schenckii 1099-18]|uniref:37S ribosomal protein rsm22 n=2 Tax=Sporothrix schenckii TaxID=29908 RepID=U7PQB5_SPOS1|nr:37S ribosomal protein rsm22 [Sporothrix schenckii 1099-18]ERS96899.1 hypothetical protein HMPREF1624_06225 [Sporothrix schenckii ATCC 58251]KJR86084.1 37S ribosomal protein rsm22 [Sporothrix schenckii 1099-18]
MSSDWVIVCPLPGSALRPAPESSSAFDVGFLNESPRPRHMVRSLENDKPFKRLVDQEKLKSKTFKRGCGSAQLLKTSKSGPLAEETHEAEISQAHTMLEPQREQKSLSPQHTSLLTDGSPDTKARELEWLLNEMGDDLRGLKVGIEDCYQLLEPADQGNTLVVSTPRTEAVKGHITRLGTRITKGMVNLKMRTLPPQTLSIDPHHPITIAPLDDLSILLARSIELLNITLTHAYPEKSSTSSSETAHALRPAPKIGTFLAAQLRVLAQALQDASAILRGPALTTSDPAWSSRSAALSHFLPQLPPGISFYIGLQESQLVLWLRALEPADMPVNLGMKFALALGTARRIEHDEADRVFNYCCEDGSAKGLHGPPPPGAAGSDSGHDSGTGTGSSTPEGPARIYVREKIRVESADPSLLSLSAKLNALSHALVHIRRNLAAVMDEEIDE